MQRLVNWIVRHLPNSFVYAVTNQAVADYSIEAVPDKLVEEISAVEVLGWLSLKEQ